MPFFGSPCSLEPDKRALWIDEPAYEPARRPYLSIGCSRSPTYVPGIPCDRDVFDLVMDCTGLHRDEAAFSEPFPHLEGARDLLEWLARKEIPGRRVLPRLVCAATADGLRLR